MHLFAPDVGLMGTTGIVGPNILQATGAGYSFQLLETDRVSVAFFGDGGVGNGAFHEGLNLAAIWQLPTIFVCENNMYATEVPFSYAARNTDVAQRAGSYGMPGIAVDGNDVLAVADAAEQAISRARAGDGPTLIECRTYRTRPHAEGMGDGGYRTEEEVNEWKARDPISAFADRMLNDGALERPALEQIDREVAGQIREALEFASNSPWPDPDTVADHIFAEGG